MKRIKETTNEEKLSRNTLVDKIADKCQLTDEEKKQLIRLLK